MVLNFGVRRYLLFCNGRIRRGPEREIFLNGETGDERGICYDGKV